MRFKAWIFTAAIFLCNSVLNASPIDQRLDSLIQQELPNANVSVLIKSLDGKTIYSREPHKAMYPASSTKLFTAAAALYQLGPQYRFTTTLSELGKNYYLNFSGDPSLTTDKLSNLLTSLKDFKMQNKSIVLDLSRFQAPFYAGGVAYDDLGWGFAAPSTAVILNGNATKYQLSAQTIGQRVSIKALSPIGGLTLINELVTASKTYAEEHCSFNIELKAHNTLRLYGCMVQAEKPKEIQFSIPEPALFTEQFIQQNLQGVEKNRKTNFLYEKTPSEAKELRSIQSEPLSKLISHMLQESDNLYADALTKTLGYIISRQGNYKQGVFAIKQILEKHTGLNPNSIQISDGMGTRYDLASAESFVQLLTILYKNEYLKPFVLEALPHMGVSGTLKTRMQKTVLENKVLAKTGSFKDTSSLSGYLFRPDGEVLIFSIISNNVSGDIKKAKDLEDKLLLEIFNASN